MEEKKLYGSEQDDEWHHWKSSTFIHEFFLSWSTNQSHSSKLVAWLERRPDCKRGGASVLPKYQGCNLGNGSVNATTKTLHNVLWEFAQSILKQLLLKAKLPGSSSVIYTEEPTWQPHEVFYVQTCWNNEQNHNLTTSDWQLYDEIKHESQLR